MQPLLQKHTPSKAGYTRATQGPYMNEKLSKEIMKRFCTKNTKSDLDRKVCNM